MRVTERMIFESAQVQVAASRDQLQQAQAQVSTGLRVVQPGDDPAAAGLIVSYTAAVQRHDSINQTAGRATEFLTSPPKYAPRTAPRRSAGKKTLPSLMG